jgi:predicted esterase
MERFCFGDEMEQMTFQELTDELMRLYPQGRYEEAFTLVEQNADRFPAQSARTTFWKMCLLSLCGRAADTLSIFQRGLDSGLWWAESQFIDTDLDPIRDLPEFKRLVEVSRKKYEEARKHVERDQTILLPERSSSDPYPLLIALHGRNGNKESNLDNWKIASKKGWLVLSPQSTQPLFSGSFCWDDATQGVEDLLYYYKQISRQYQIDPQRIVIAGFSQGSGMAVYAALSGKVGAQGFIGVGTFMAEPALLTSFASHSQPVRGYFVTGEKDNTLEKAKAIQKILKEHQIQFAEEVHPDLGHEFPPDFEKSFDKSINFIFTEQE